MTSPSERSQWPLWVMLWCFENDTIAYPEPTNELCGALLQTWLSLTQDDDRCLDFQRSLFNAQLNTDRILREWMWWLTFADVDVLSDAGLGILSKHWDQSAYGSPGQPHKLVESGDSEKYSKCLSHLLWSEFAPVKAAAVTRTKLLQLARKECAIHAACMRIARECLLFQTPIANQDVKEENVKMCSSTNNTQWPLSASALINACPWLEFETSAYDLPHYLWDIQQRATVEVASIKGSVDGYIAISHTWGRWKQKAADGSTKFANCPGARWPIPKNDRFNVSTLPEILEQLRDQTRYVWLDLLCIPQDRSPLATIEVAKQSAIFRNAARCICWLVDVDQWHGMDMAIKWLCAQYILQHDDGSWPADQPTPLQDDLSRLCELVPAGKDFYKHGEWSLNDINPWFTSLWTLQEVCIRADMMLCDKTFTPLAVGPVAFPVTIADISALLYQVKIIGFAERERAPVVIRQLYGLWFATGLHGIFKLSRAVIIQLGNLRQCSGKYPEARAEAIMSAMGVVDWFLPFKAKPDEEKNQSLILGMYPLSFVEELRVKAGSGSFFSDATMDFEMIAKAFYFENWIDHIRVVGSMLPFGPGKITNTTDMSIFDADELCTRSWTLNDNGTVRINRAFLQSSSEHDPSVPFMCTWFGPDIATTDYQPRYYMEPANLTQYLNQYKPHRRNYAVALTRTSLHVQGILLKELSANVLMRIGNYSWYVPSRDGTLVGQEVDVDWTVI